MKLFEYDTVEKLNFALTAFKRRGVRIVKVKLLTVHEMPRFYILIDEDGEYQKE